MNRKYKQAHKQPCQSGYVMSKFDSRMFQIKGVMSNFTMLHD